VQATTVGLGPFYPAIRITGVLWVNRSVSFDNEDAAHNAAIIILNRLQYRQTAQLKQAGYAKELES